MAPLNSFIYVSLVFWRSTDDSKAAASEQLQEAETQTIIRREFYVPRTTRCRLGCVVKRNDDIAWLFMYVDSPCIAYVVWNSLMPFLPS